MEFGVNIFPCEYTIPPTLLGPALESRGFESLWVAGPWTGRRDFSAVWQG